ncbi:hypothetical protein [Streptomyces sp. HNM0574]|uniref:hypothetical protein n=1 Tax=Streptomyces sp. HNM0574 TaxID=2714954 RepID=UPI001F0D42A7|nr:hypothetical protein [Streptomyces sp. HNM0574]
MWERILRRRRRTGGHGGTGGDGSAVPPPQRRRGANLFEVAAVYVAASADGDDRSSAEAASLVSPEALFFGVDELACRAVIALARTRDESPYTVAGELLGVAPPGARPAEEAQPPAGVRAG